MTARCLHACNFRERASVGSDGLRNGLVIDELTFAMAGDEFGLAENLEMVRDGCGGNAAHGDDIATVHAVGG